MTKATKKITNLKTPKEASTLFHNIMAASVSGSKKPIVKKKGGKKKNNT